METGTVGPREPVGYRFLIQWPDGRSLAKLQAYYVSDVAKITVGTVAYGQGQRSSPIASSRAAERWWRRSVELLVA